jgi:hypothetical protein
MNKKAAASPAHFIELFGAVFYGQQQLLLMGTAVSHGEFG